ncbi:MAG: 4-hydroxythreonine-4-phosphate dehydrogenase PdxA [Candidatus Eisenbacteria bacterium]
MPVAISMGDPLGVGPEVTMKALFRSDVAERVSPIVVGIPALLERAWGLAKTAGASGRGRGAPRAGAGRAGVRVASVGGTAARGIKVVTPRELPEVAYLTSKRRSSAMPRMSARDRGTIAVACVREGVRLCLEGHASALVTAPISKASLKAARLPYVGHTDMLGDLCRSRKTLMMFVWGERRISLVTTHVPLRIAAGSLTRRNVSDAIRLTEEALRLLFHVRRPSIAVLSLNPHRGESGLLGGEERTVIEPSVKALAAGGVRVRGPFAADSFFAKESWGEFDAVVAMYHDQGLIPAKLVSSGNAVNLTLGLPFVRTSPGHGTGEQIAWKGVADVSPMASAILLAAELTANVRLPLRWKSVRLLEK